MRLFYEKKFEIFKQETIQRILNSAKNYDWKNKDSSEIAKIVIEQNYKFKVPVFGDKVTSSLILEDGSGNKHEPNIHAQYSRPDVCATGIYSFTFSGGHGFFNIKPTSFVEVGEPAEVKDTVLVVKVRSQYVTLELPDPHKDAIRRRILAAKQNIDSNLESLRADMNAFELELPTIVTSYIDELKKQKADQDKRDDDINPF